MISISDLEAELTVLVRKAKASDFKRTSLTLGKLHEFQALLFEIKQGYEVSETESKILNKMAKQMEKLAYEPHFYCKKCDMFHDAGLKLCV